jgi:undecaprenyl diphosphate synthase
MALDFISQSSHYRRKLHAAIIMDGNGRWATARGLPRIAGHRAGADAVRRTVEAAPDLGVGILTLYAFSSDNWRRPAPEVSALMELLDIYLRKETRRCLENGVRLEVIGRRDRLDAKLVAAIERTEAATAAGSTLTLRVAVDYSAREAIRSGRIGPDVDLLIRTGGEQRLSDFLLWECAYAELIFSKRMWPDFDEHDLAAAVREFEARERRFGGLPEQQPHAACNGHGAVNGSWLD